MKTEADTRVMLPRARNTWATNADRSGEGSSPRSLAGSTARQQPESSRLGPRCHTK